MTKDLALLVGADQRWLSTTGFLDKVAENLTKAMARRKPPSQLPPRHCERSEAIHDPATETVDCFVATLLAMTRGATRSLPCRCSSTPHSQLFPCRRRL